MIFNDSNTVRQKDNDKYKFENSQKEEIDKKVMINLQLQNEI